MSSECSFISHYPHFCFYLLYSGSVSSIFWFCIFNILVLHLLCSGSVFYILVLYLLHVIKYGSSWSSTYLYIQNSLIFSLLYSMSCSLSSIHSLVSVSCILVLYLLYSGSPSSLCHKYVSSWSSTYLYIHNSLIFSRLYSVSYSLSSIHVSIYLQFNHLSVLISTCFSLQCLVCSAHISRYSIVSPPVYSFKFTTTPLTSTPWWIQ